MTDDLEFQESLRKELDELIVLAEKSASSIDTLSDSRRHTLVILVSNLLIHVVVVFAMTIMNQRKDLWFGEISPTANFILVILGLLIVSFGAFLSFLQYMKLRKTVHDLFLERHIHGRLVSLLDEQSRRMDSKPLSIVTRATIDIRIKRLDRGTV